MGLIQGVMFKTLHSVKKSKSRIQLTVLLQSHKISKKGKSKEIESRLMVSLTTWEERLIASEPEGLFDDENVLKLDCDDGCCTVVYIY